MLNKAANKFTTALAILFVLAILLLIAGAVSANVKDLHGQQSVTTDAQSTTGPIPEGGPRGAAAEAGKGYEPGPISKVIEHVPPYIWRDGCGPTTAGMILGYWDWYMEFVLKQYGHLDWIIPGEAETQTAAVNQVIASDGHELDYAIPHDVYPDLRLDKSEPPQGDEHKSNSLADFMSTSFSSRDNYFGWSWFSDVPKAFEGYLASVNPGGFVVTAYNVRLNDDSLTWDIYKSLIDRNMPVMLLVDSSADGETDHFIPGMGYDDTNPVKYYAAYNTWDGAVHWYRWGPMVKGTQYGVYGGTILDIEHTQVTPTPTSTLTPFPPTFTPLATFTATIIPIPTVTATSTPVNTPVVVVEPPLPDHRVFLPIITSLDAGLIISNIITLGAFLYVLLRLMAVERERRV